MIREDGVIPLINIVFLLLIFFLLAGRITAPESMEIALPTSTQTEGDPARPATILITAGGAILVDGAPQDLMVAVTRLAAAGQNAPIIIRADGNAPALRVLEVASALRMASIEASRLVIEAGGS